MNRWLLALLVSGLTVVTAGAAPDPRRALALGEKAYTATNHAEAARRFSEAAEQAAAARLDPAVAHYNHGLALLRDNQAAPAAEKFQLAARTTDLDLQQRALFNRGNALFKLAGELETAGQAQPALQGVEESLAMYEQAMMLRPDDPNPKVNFELATREKKRLEEQIQQQQQQDRNQGDQKKDQQQEQDKGGQQENQPQPPESSPDQKEQDGTGNQPPPPEQAGQNSSSPEDQDGKDQEKAPVQAQDMTREEATRLLDAMKQQEQAAREQIAQDRLRMNMGQLPPVEKDW